MNASAPDCRHARIAIGGDPQHLPADVSAHIATCAECSRFRDETLALDQRLRVALELPLPEFRRRAPATRRFALAASVVLALLVAGGAWLFKPAPALADEIVAHVRDEPGSWSASGVLAPAAVAQVLSEAGVDFDMRMPVVYAMACPFHGRRVPHFVVQTDAGPITVMLLAHERVAARTEFDTDGYRGVLLPAGSGSVAVLARGGTVPQSVAAAVLAGTHWR